MHCMLVNRFRTGGQASPHEHLTSPCKANSTAVSMQLAGGASTACSALVWSTTWGGLEPTSRGQGHLLEVVQQAGRASQGPDGLQPHAHLPVGLLPHQHALFLHAPTHADDPTQKAWSPTRRQPSNGRHCIHSHRLTAGKMRLYFENAQQQQYIDVIIMRDATSSWELPQAAQQPEDGGCGPPECPSERRQGGSLATADARCHCAPSSAPGPSAVPCPPGPSPATTHNSPVHAFQLQAALPAPWKCACADARRSV